MKNSNVRYTVVRKGTSLVLAATLATGMVPAIALAQDANESDAPVAVQADNGFAPVEDKTYTVPVAWTDAAGMSKNYFDDTAQVTYSNGAWTVEFTSNTPDKIGDISCNDDQQAKVVKVTDSSKTYQLTLSSLEDVSLKIVVPAMIGFMPNGVSATLSFDMDLIHYGSGYSVYYEGQQNDHVKGYFASEVKIYPKGNVYDVDLTANSLGEKGTLGDIKYDGKIVEKVKHEDGSVTYALPLSSVDGTYDFEFNCNIPAMGGERDFALQLVLDGGTYSGDKTDPGKDDQKVDKTALNAAIEAAEAIEQGEKSDAAWKALQDAISGAKQVRDNDNASSDEVKKATETLNEAVETFEKADDVAPEVNIKDGKTYKVTAAVMKEDGSGPSMSQRYFETEALIRFKDGVYDIRVTPSAAASGLLEGMTYELDGATYSAKLVSGSYQILAKSIDSLIGVGMKVGAPMNSTMKAALSVDASNAQVTSDMPSASEDKPEVVNPGTNNNGNNGNAGETPTNEQANQGFQVGHTYQVPASWLKHNSTEESMAAKYFGDTALVRPQSDGTFKVSFSATSEGANHIISLAYNGSDLAKSGNQYTVSIPKADSDTVVPISMTIKEMEQLGGGAQIADMHLKLSQAKDLGTGQDNAVASSSKILSQTGDNVAGVAGAAAVAAVAAGAAVVARRRMQRR